MIHFDYNDGNYMIDYNSGQITVYDFYNSCFGWYMFDLANIWGKGIDWIQFEPDADKRKKFMEDYFEIVLGIQIRNQARSIDVEYIALVYSSKLHGEYYRCVRGNAKQQRGAGV